MEEGGTQRCRPLHINKNKWINNDARELLYRVLVMVSLRREAIFEKRNE